MSVVGWWRPKAPRAQHRTAAQSYKKTVIAKFLTEQKTRTLRYSS